MILSFRNEEPARHRKGQKECGKGISGGIFGPWCRAKAARILARLDIAREPKDMALPGWRLSPLNGQTDIGAEGPLFQQRWAVWVTGNWWIVFRFQGQGKDTGQSQRKDKHKVHIVDVVDVALVDFSKRRRPLRQSHEGPIAPGLSVRQDCLEPLGLSVAQAAKVLGVMVWELNNLFHSKSGITPEMAIRLASAFGGTAEAWRALQTTYDLTQARQKEHLIKVNLYVGKGTVHLSMLAEEKDPPYPGETVRQDCLEPLGLSVAKAAKALGVPVRALNNLFYGKSGITPEMAIRLAKAFGGTAEAWLAFQTAYDLAQARQKEPSIPVKPYVATGLVRLSMLAEEKDPPYPGETVRQDCLQPLGLSIAQAAKVLGVPVWELNYLFYKRFGISPVMAIRLDKAFGGTAAAWLALQTAYDLAQARKKEHLITVKPYAPEGTVHLSMLTKEANPSYPGQTMRQDCLEPLGLSVAQAAKVLGVPVWELRHLCFKKFGIKPEMAIRLATAFGGTAEAWLALQTAYDLAQARKKEPSITVKSYVRPHQPENLSPAPPLP